MEKKDIKAPGYMTYREAALLFSLMPDEEAALAIKATVRYYLYGEAASLSGTAETVFEIMRADIDRNEQKYAQIVRRNSANIRKRWDE